MKAYFRLFAEVLRANVAAIVQYRTSFVMQLVGMMLNNASFLVFWVVLLSHTGSVGGWGLTEVLYLWALGPAAFGLAHVIFGNARHLGLLIVQGDLDVYLLQPKDPYFQALMSRTQASAWGDLAYGLVLLPFLTLDPMRIGLFLVFTCTGALIFVGAFGLVQSLAFWWGNVSGIGQAFTEFLLTFSLYPEKVFPLDMRWVLYTLVPSGFVVFLPVETIRRFDLVGFLLVLGAAGLTVGLSILVFRRGLKRYESGNSIGARL